MGVEICIMGVTELDEVRGQAVWEDVRIYTGVSSVMASGWGGGGRRGGCWSEIEFLDKRQEANR